MRLNEIANVKASDIDWKAQIITIMGKGNKQSDETYKRRLD